MSEPIEERRELDEGKKGDGEFFEAGADTTMTFNEAEEIFDFVPAEIVTAVKGRRTAARAFGRDADSGALAAQPRAKVVGVEALDGAAWRRSITIRPCARTIRGDLEGGLRSDRGGHSSDFERRNSGLTAAYKSYANTRFPSGKRKWGDSRNGSKGAISILTL